MWKHNYNIFSSYNTYSSFQYFFNIEIDRKNPNNFCAEQVSFGYIDANDFWTERLNFMINFKKFLLIFTGIHVAVSDLYWLKNSCGFRVIKTRAHFSKMSSSLQCKICRSDRSTAEIDNPIVLSSLIWISFSVILHKISLETSSKVYRFSKIVEYFLS